METITFETKVTVREAFLSMYEFLNRYYDFPNKPDEINMLLSQLQLWESDNGMIPMNESIFRFWLDSTTEVLKDKHNEGGYIKANIKMKK